MYSDSVFWLSQRLYDPLLSWYISHSPLPQEFDAYSQLLPAFGDRVQVEQQYDEYHLNPCHEYLSDMKTLMKKSSLRVIILEQSTFYHFGTMKEYIDNLTRMKVLKRELDLESVAHCNLSDPFSLSKDDDEIQEVDTNSNSLIIGSFISSPDNIILKPKNHAIIEWSEICIPLDIGDEVIISNCVMKKEADVKLLQPVVRIFDRVAMHTVPIKESGTVHYVTCMLCINDDIKCSSHDVDNVSFFGVGMRDVMRTLQYKKKQVISEEKKHSLWNLRLFPKASTPSLSFWKTYAMMNRLLTDSKECLQYSQVQCPDHQLYSLQNLSSLKDLDTLLSQRDELFRKINGK